MKNRKFDFFYAFAISVAIFVTGCQDPCSSDVCVKGECIEGDCVCETGYFGADCSTALNEKFSGNYLLNELCTVSGESGPYAVTVAALSGTTNEVTFVGLWEVPNNIVTANVATDGVSFTIARQPILSVFEIQATGGSITATGSTINLTYKIYQADSASVTDQCTATLTKQF